MRQYLTSQQLVEFMNESPKGFDKWVKWFDKTYTKPDQFDSIIYDDKTKKWRTEDNNTHINHMCGRSMIGYIPSIGQLIDFLGFRYFYRIGTGMMGVSKKGGSFEKYSVWVVEVTGNGTYNRKELVDALWDQVKDLLNDETKNIA